MKDLFHIVCSFNQTIDGRTSVSIDMAEVSAAKKVFDGIGKLDEYHKLLYAVSEKIEPVTDEICDMVNDFLNENLYNLDDEETVDKLLNMALSGLLKAIMDGGK